MGQEIEKKYLLRDENGFDHSTHHLGQIAKDLDALVGMVKEGGKDIRQGYMPVDAGLNLARELLGINPSFTPVEARLRLNGNDCFFTLKGDGSLERNEVEVPIERSFYERHWHLTKGKRIEKSRLKVPYLKYTAEIDLYTGETSLIIAEVEVPSREEALSLPPLGKDVTEDKSYKNKNLAR